MAKNEESKKISLQHDVIYEGQVYLAGEHTVEQRKLLPDPEDPNKSKWVNVASLIQASHDKVVEKRVKAAEKAEAEAVAAAGLAVGPSTVPAGHVVVSAETLQQMIKDGIEQHRLSEKYEGEEEPDDEEEEEEEDTTSSSSGSSTPKNNKPAAS